MNMKKSLLISILSVLMIANVAMAQKSPMVYNVRDFGAKGDGKTLDTKAIDKAIETAAGKGGGTVYFPAGDYLSVTIHLKSNIALYLDQGATIVADSMSKTSQYDLPEKNANEVYQDYGHSHFHN